MRRTIGWPQRKLSAAARSGPVNELTDALILAFPA
jgi:hypothetical protein